MSYFPIVIALALLSFLTVSMQKELTEDGRCAREESGARSVKLSLIGWKNSTGEWVTDLSARKEISNHSRNLNFELEHKIFECDGKTVIHLGGHSREHARDDGNVLEKLLSNEKCGKSAAIINDGRSAFRLNPDKEDGHAILLTSRVLNANELFEIRLEKKLSKWGGYSIGIGVTAIPVSSFPFPGWMGDVKSKTWMMYDDAIYVDSLKKSNYGKNLSSLVVGDRIGIKRTGGGELHIYVNGVDQRIAATGIPQDVHGVVDLIRDFISVTIV